MKDGERQVSPTLDGVRYDHLARYRWACHHLNGTVLDAACGIGYGSNILANHGFTVRSVDIDQEAIDYGLKHYNHPNITFQCLPLDKVLPLSDCTVAFEIIEHIEDPLPFLKRVKGRLLASVPNEDVFPYRNYKFHYRHYTKDEFTSLLNAAGFIVEDWYGQEGPESDVTDIMGRTIIAIARKR